ncbi:hypothetical protein ciss_01450 [Carboxydothermus islandicus]|uniref:Metallo-beta-lactamase domain-containing protein n=1 Tax=Carboxydothermus islandicus TaxID=661089 RepID=A0A1L8CZ49_9THEO|nr:MBL fold metallo-hydrolase [Carboxydothermus islandicus]GAV24212.1 hypothetical protein ciss_01450 [Carboxydothermus islandicus]
MYLRLSTANTDKVRFIAIPVGQGDAFFLETPTVSILVDGGRSIKNFAFLFRKFTKKENVDIIICTHNDADHANGIIGFIESGLKCKELWLPGRWAAVLPHLVKPISVIAEELWEQVLRITKNKSEEYWSNEFNNDKSIIERFGDYIAEKNLEHMRLKERPAEENENWPVKFKIGMANRGLWADWELYDWRLIRMWKMLWMHWSWEKELFWQAIEAGLRIRRIAEAAYHRGIPVRWFEYNYTHPGLLHENPILQPLNAREITQVKPCPSEMLFALLSLTTVNRESLVFFAKLSSDIPGILFTADSDLKGIQLPYLENSIVTAPHHGSDANAYAYKAITAAAQGTSVIWVRSDGRFRERPGTAFLTAPGKRFCTICKSPGITKQPIRFRLKNRQWVSNSRRCRCN